MDEIGSTAKRLGNKAFVLTGTSAWRAAGDRIVQSLQAENLDFVKTEFQGFCCPESIDAYSASFSASGADFIIGVGGGKVMDTAKGMAYRTGANLILAPTSAAQCACCANVIILYDQNGDPLPYSWQLVHSAEAVFVDTDILVRHCPPRMLAAGVADAIAKVPEIAFLRRITDDWKQVLLADYSYMIARTVYEMYEKVAVKAMEDAARHQITKEVDDVITANILLTGLSSTMAAGTRQIAFPHNIYYAICKHFKPQQLKYMHGEMVSSGLLLQYAINGEAADHLPKCQALLRAIGAPTTPMDLGIVMDEANRSILLDYCKNAMPYLTADQTADAAHWMQKLWTLPASAI